jgi:hypothetical protein
LNQQLRHRRLIPVSKIGLAGGLLTWLALSGRLQISRLALVPLSSRLGIHSDVQTSSDLLHYGLLIYPLSLNALAPGRAKLFQRKRHAFSDWDGGRSRVVRNP